MVNQYVNNKPLHIGSADVRVALYEDTFATVEDAVSIGLLDGVKFAKTGTDTVVKTDNADDIDLGQADEQAEISATAWKNLDLSVLHTLMGESGTLTTNTAQTPVSVSDELHVMTGATGKTLKYKNEGTPALVTNIVVKSGATTFTANTDYLTYLNPQGYTVICRVPGGAITDGASVTVSYKYTPATFKKFTYGGGVIPKPLHVWLINTNAAGKKFIIELYKVSSVKSVELTFGSDSSKALVQMPVSIIGKPDSTRPVNDALFAIYDEQGV